MKVKVKSVIDNDKSIGLVSKHGVLYLPKTHHTPVMTNYLWRVITTAFPHKFSQQETIPQFIDLNELIGCFMYVHNEQVVYRDTILTRMVAGN